MAAAAPFAAGLQNCACARRDQDLAVHHAHEARFLDRLPGSSVQQDQ